MTDSVTSAEDYESGYSVGLNNLNVPHMQSGEWVRGFEDGVDAQFAAIAERYK